MLAYWLNGFKQLGQLFCGSPGYEFLTFVKFETETLAIHWQKSDMLFKRHGADGFDMCQNYLGTVICVIFQLQSFNKEQQLQRCR